MEERAGSHENSFSFCWFVILQLKTQEVRVLSWQPNPRLWVHRDPSPPFAFTGQAPSTRPAVTHGSSCWGAPRCCFLERPNCHPHHRSLVFTSMWIHTCGNPPAFKRQGFTELIRPQSTEWHYLIPTWARAHWTGMQVETENDRTSPISSPVSLQIRAPHKWTRPAK